MPLKKQGWWLFSLRVSQDNIDTHKEDSQRNYFELGWIDYVSDVSDFVDFVFFGPAGGFKHNVVALSFSDQSPGKGRMD